MIKPLMVASAATACMQTMAEIAIKKSEVFSPCLRGENASTVALLSPKPHNRLVANTPWQRRIQRANDLIAQHAFAAEILGFYIHVAGFQDILYQKLEGARKAGVSPARPQDTGATFAFPPDADQLASFPAFLSLIEDKAPAHFAQIARDLSNAPSTSLSETSWAETLGSETSWSETSWSDLLTRCWSSTNEPSAPQEFLALAFLQPSAELVRSGTVLQLESYTLALCPLCHRKPSSALLRPQADGGRRSLLCGFCVTEWEYRRVVCPACGEQDHAKLPVYTAESFPHIRVECCDTCRTYLKSIDLTKNGLADPLVDELAFVPLDLWAQERGYAKIRANLLGM
jgi:FdhE protein